MKPFKIFAFIAFTLSILSCSNDDNLIDPRTLYYFSNQTDDVNKADAVAFPNRFASRPDHYNDAKYASMYRFNRLAPFLYTRTSASSASSPFWGSDHGNNTGRPQDGDKVTVVGVYPAGGRYGNGNTVQSDAGTIGQKGAGIMPIVLSSYVRFLKAEVQLTIFSNPLLAKTEMLAGVNASITKSATLFSGLPQPSVTVVNNYRDFVDNFYTNNPNKQLEAIMKEYFIASWGNGIETYNNYRRTGFPSNFQPTIELSSGDYYTTLFYPSDSQSNNQNKPANLKTRKVFWDVNSPILN